MFLVGFLLFANAFLAVIHFICVLAIYCQLTKILFPPLFFPLSCVHVPPPPVITYLIIH
jgi:hypothetical protein